MADINMLEIPQQVANALGIPLFAGQILTSIIFCMFFILLTTYLTKGTNLLLELVVALGSFTFTVAVGWMPSWVLIMMALAIAGLWAGNFRGWLTGRGER